MVGMPGGAIAVASDHAGFDLAESLKRDLPMAGRGTLDLGTASTLPATALGRPAASPRFFKGSMP